MLQTQILDLILGSQIQITQEPHERWSYEYSSVCYQNNHGSTYSSENWLPSNPYSDMWQQCR